LRHLNARNYNHAPEVERARTSYIPACMTMRWRPNNPDKENRRRPQTRLGPSIMSPGIQVMTTAASLCFQKANQDNPEKLQVNTGLDFRNRFPRTWSLSYGLCDTSWRKKVIPEAVAVVSISNSCVKVSICGIKRYGRAE
jgi:hypothetical protein